MIQKKIYFLDVGFVEDTVLYELTPTEVLRMSHATINEIVTALQDKNVSALVVEDSMPIIIEALKSTRKFKKVMKLLNTKERSQK